MHHGITFGPILGIMTPGRFEKFSLKSTIFEQAFSGTLYHPSFFIPIESLILRIISNFLYQSKV